MPPSGPSAVHLPFASGGNTAPDAATFSHRYQRDIWSKERLTVGRIMAVVILLTMGVVSTGEEVYRIGAVFQAENFSDWAQSFQEAVSRTNEVKERIIRVDGVALPDLGNPHSILVYLCDAIAHNNLSVVVVSGNQDLINTVSIATRHVRLPLIAYNTDRKPVTIRVSQVVSIHRPPPSALTRMADRSGSCWLIRLNKFDSARAF